MIPRIFPVREFPPLPPRYLTECHLSDIAENAVYSFYLRANVLMHSVLDASQR